MLGSIASKRSIKIMWINFSVKPAANKQHRGLGQLRNIPEQVVVSHQAVREHWKKF
jgi:hypothetical protein